MRAYVFLLIYLSFLPMVFFTPFIGVLLWCWISLMNPHMQIYGLLAGAYGQGVVICLFISLLLSRERKVPPNALLVWLMAGLMVHVSLAHLLSYSLELGYPKWDIAFKGLLLAILSSALINTKLRIQAWTWIIVLSIGFYGAKGGIWSLLLGGSGRILGPPGTMLGDNNHIATGISMMIPLMVYLALHTENRLMRLGLWAMAFFSLAAVVFTYSRGGLLSLVGMGAVLWWRSPRKLGVAALLIAFATVIYHVAPPELFERWGTIRSYEADQSAMSRLKIWAVALQLGLEHPIFGVGLRGTLLSSLVDPIDETVRARAIHNSYLEILAETGFVGLALHLMMFVAVLYYTRSVRRMTRGRDDFRWAYDLSSMIQVSLAGYGVGSFFLSLGFFDGWWFVAVLSLAVREHVRKALVVTEPQSQRAAAHERGVLVPAAGHRAL